VIEATHSAQLIKFFFNKISTYLWCQKAENRKYYNFIYIYLFLVYVTKNIK